MRSLSVPSCPQASSVRARGLPLIALVVAALVASWALVAPSAQAQRKRAKKKPTVAILYFDYDGSNEEMGFLRKGLTQMLVTDLTGAPEVDIVERVRLEDALAELELGKSKKIDPRSANRVGKLLGARYLVMGGYFDMAGTLRMDARVVEVETGKVVASMGKHAKVDAFMNLEQYLATELGKVFRTELSAASTAPRKQPKPRKRPKRPETLDARQAAAYGKALDAVDRGDKGEAETILEGLVRDKPDFEIAALDLASLRK
ncbi:CsgG/HfaB family protein [Haliangium sp.]|uniref:CsgG/HfaB family protein n=1 Tax=Haliangium sp. TaxID=2663208 RepID=UPI003D09E28C